MLLVLLCLSLLLFHAQLGLRLLLLLLKVLGERNWLHPSRASLAHCSKLRGI